MIERFRFGNPIETDAVAEMIPVTEGMLPFFQATEEATFVYKFADKDIVYGLGEQVRGINKRGWIYKSCNADDPHHQEDTKSLYGSHNFLLISGEKLFGVFFDCAGNITFDVGYTHRDTLWIAPEEPSLDVYMITGESEKDIVKQFRKLIGRSYIAPLWAFGYGQSRWGYMNAQDIDKVVLIHHLKTL